MKTKLTTILLIAGFFCAQSQTWDWFEDELSYARSGLSATVLDDTIFFSGGQGTNYNYPGIIDIYDVGEDQWDTIELQTPGKAWTSAVSTNGMVFFAGGNNYDPDNPSWTFFSEIDVFTKETGEWTIENLSEPRQHIGTVAHGNIVFFAGGLSAISTALFYHNDIDIYDTETKTWLPPDSLSIPRCLMGAVAACGKLFFAGGATESGQVTDVVDIYDTETGLWDVEYLSEARAYIAAVAYEGLVYFAGGTYANNTGSDVIDIYNCEDGTWEDIETLSEPRIVTAHNVYNALVFTGMFDSFDLENYWANFANGTVDVYYPATGQWDYTVPDLNPARYYYADASYANKIYYAGGSLGGGVKTNIVSILEYTPCFPDGITFTTQAEIDNFQTNYPYCSEIGGDVEINGSDITDLNGLNFVTAIAGNLSIINCDILSNITGLFGLNSIDGAIEIIDNEILSSLSGLENIEAGSITDLSIHGNDSLSNCDVTSICDYLINSLGTYNINDNLAGCNNKEEIEYWCLITDVEQNYVKEQFTISPNPTSGPVNLQFSISDQRFVILDLFEISGVKVKSILNEEKLPGTYEIKIDLRDLEPGVYFCVLETNEGVQTKKLIKLN